MPLGYVLALAVIASLAWGQGKASARDVFAGPALEEGAASWTGLHAGVGLGGRWSDTNWTTDCLAPTAFPATCPNDGFVGLTRVGNDNPASFDSAGARLNAYFGGDLQVDRLVLGLEAEMAWADDRSRHLGIPGTWSADFGPDMNTARIENAWDASLRGRVGVLLTPRTLVYFTGGLALLKQETRASCAGTYPVGWCIAPNDDSSSSVETGWTAGGGIERMLTPEWTLRAEYRYSDYGTRSFTLFDDQPLDAVEITVEQKTSLFYIGLTRRF